jgi:hypothetical protein
MAGHPSITQLAARVLPVGFAESFKQLSDVWFYLLGPFWVLWLALKGEWQALSEFGFYAASTPLMFFAALIFTRSLFRVDRNSKDRTALFGLSFFMIPLLPVLILPAEKTMLHNLYVPSAGLAIAAGHFLRVRLGKDRRWLNMVAAVAVPAILILGGVHYIAYKLEMSWPVSSARAAWEYLEDLRQHHPELPQGAILYFERTGDPNWPFLTGGGDLFRVFYMDETLQTIYADYEQRIPDVDRRATVLRFRETNGNLVPVTREALPTMTNDN